MAKKKEFEYEYDPIKEVDNEKASAVVWTTKVIEKALEGMQKGLPLKVNPFIGKNTKLLKPDLVYKRTAEEVEDYIRCKQDPIYFAKKCFLMTPEGLQSVKLRDYQEDYLNHLKNNRFSIWLACRQAGKCLFLNSTLQIVIKNINNISKCNIEKYNKLLQCVNTNDEIVLPLYELYNMYCDKTETWVQIYNAYKNNDLDLIREIESKFNYDDFEKIICTFDISDEILVNTDTGYKPITHIHLTKPYNIYHIELENGYYIDCADTHILYDANMNGIFAKNLNVGEMIQTDAGLSRITCINIDDRKFCMGDITVQDDNHRFYSNGILSHNSTTTAIFCLWSILFNTDKKGLILSKSGPAGIDLLNKVKDMYMYLPYHLKGGIMKWNQHSISFDNNSSISTEAFGPTAGLGQTINFLILDEFAWCPPNDVDLFYQNVIPVCTTQPDATICIMSTQNGFNLFYKLWQSAITKKSIYAPFKVDWWQVPQYNPATRQWEKRTEAWKQKMVGVLGSEEAFYYQYGTQFSASDKCLASRELLSRLHQDEILFTPINEEQRNETSFTQQEYLYINPEYDIHRLKEGFFILLVDLAEGGGGDYTIVNIIEMIGPDTFEQVGYWRSNSVSLEDASLAFWTLHGNLFNPDRVITSLEWNTYGALFYNYIECLNEPEYKPECSYRYNMRIGTDEFDISSFIHYKKGSQEEEIAGLGGNKFNKSLIPGIRFSAGNKKTACTLLKSLLERNQIIIRDITTISELENFEDKTGSGSYKASYGHDDLIMTFCQLPMLMNTARYKEFVEEFNAYQLNENVTTTAQDFIADNLYSGLYDLPYGGFVPPTFQSF